jgi:hypothetical protein
MYSAYLAACNYAYLYIDVGPNLAIYYNTYGNLLDELGDKQHAADKYNSGLAVLDATGNRAHVYYDIIRKNLSQLHP